MGGGFRQLKYSWALLLLIGFARPVASQTDEVQIAKSQLKHLVTLFTLMERFVEPLDQARLFLFKRTSQSVLDSIETNGLAHAKTMRDYQQLIITFRYSYAFFRQIESPANHAHIVEVLRINESISKARGFDDSPYTQITANVFTHMRKLMLQLEDSADMPLELRQRVSGLQGDFGEVIAIAKQGDRPRTFETAVPLYHKVVELYPQFNEIMASSAAFEVILEIQGLNEFYADFAQIDR